MRFWWRRPVGVGCHASGQGFESRRVALTVKLSNPRAALHGLAEQGVRVLSDPPTEESRTGSPPSNGCPTRQPQRRLKPYEIEALIAAYRDGMTTMKDLARAFGIHRVTVSAHLRSSGGQARGQGLHDEDVPEAARLYEAGWSSLRLGEKFGVAPDTVLTTLRRWESGSDQDRADHRAGSHRGSDPVNVSRCSQRCCAAGLSSPVPHDRVGDASSPRTSRRTGTPATRPLGDSRPEVSGRWSGALCRH